MKKQMKAMKKLNAAKKKKAIKKWVPMPGKKRGPPAVNRTPKPKKPKVVKTSKKIVVSDEQKYKKHKKIYKDVEQALIENFTPGRPKVSVDDEDDWIDNDDDETVDPKQHVPAFIKTMLSNVWNQLEIQGEFSKESMASLNNLHRIAQTQ